MKHFKEINYLIEAESDILTIYSIGIPSYIRHYEGVITIGVLNNMASNIEEVLGMLNISADKIINLHETVYGLAIRPLKISNPKKVFEILRSENKNMIFTNFRLLEVRKILDDIRSKTYNSLIETDYGTKQMRPDFLVLETDAISIKVPNKFTYLDNSEPSWDYDYLLYPTQNIDMKLFRVDHEVLNNLASTIECPETAQAIRDFTIPTDISLFEGFTPNRYEVSRMRLRDISIRTKALINVILDQEWQNTTGSDYFGVYQQSRMARENKASFVEIKYRSDMSEEKTIPSIFKDITGEGKEEAMFIDTNFVEEEINRLNTKEELYVKPELEAIYTYSKLLQDGDNVKAMLTYEQLEEERERARGEIFASNLALTGNLKTMMSMFRNVYAKAELSLFDYEYLLGDNSHNRIKLGFQNREVTITDGQVKQDLDGIHKEDVEWLESKDLEVDQNGIQHMGWEVNAKDLNF